LATSARARARARFQARKSALVTKRPPRDFEWACITCGDVPAEKRALLRNAPLCTKCYRRHMLGGVIEFSVRKILGG